MTDSRTVARPKEPCGRSAPFSIRLLASADDRDLPPLELDDDRTVLLLPASYRTENGDLRASIDNIEACIKAELDIHRLHNILGWLRVAGQLRPPRPLHQHALVGREIHITEQMDIHLVWTSGKIFIKPLPRFLLEPSFWAKYLRCRQDCGSLEDTECEHQDLWRCALGFLYSYTAMIRHESDFHLARQKQLLPEEVEWPRWIECVRQLNTEHIYPKINPRFCHGELRLSRLNIIYQISETTLKGYVAHWDQYSTFFQDNFSWLAGTIVYIVVVLTAMQVGLATEDSTSHGAFQSISYGFAVFSIMGPLISAGLIILTFCFVFVYHWRQAVATRVARVQHTDCGHIHGKNWPAG